MAELSLHGLRKRFGATEVLDGIDLNVPAGSLLALLGPSGSGKTTLLRIVCGFERADAGGISVAGRALVAPGVFVPPEQRRIGYVPQEGALFPHLTVAENIAFGLPRRERQDRRRIAGLLERVGLPADFAARPPQALSGGQQQRVALARALAPSPALVLLDEPFSSLDAALRVQTRQAVAQALAESGATALLVTHDQSEALSMGRQVAVLWQGRLIQVASPETLYRQPVSTDLAGFLGEAVLIPGQIEQGAAVCVLGRLPLLNTPSSGPARIMLRPEQLRLRAASGQKASGVLASVLQLEFYGHDARVRLRLPGGSEPLLLSARVPGHACPAPGDLVALEVEGAVMAYPWPDAEACAGAAYGEADCCGLVPG